MAASLCNMIQQKLARLCRTAALLLGQTTVLRHLADGSGPAIAHSFTSHPFSVSRYRCMGYKKPTATPTITPPLPAEGYVPPSPSDAYSAKRGQFFSLISISLADQLIEHLGLLTSLMPHPHCIVHRNDRHNAGHRKNGRLHANAASRSNDHRTDRGAVGTGHAAVSPHPLQLEFTQQDEIDDRFEHLSREPAQQGYGQDLR